MADQSRFEDKKKALLDGLVRRGYLKDKRLIKAFMDIPLEEFIDEQFFDPFKIYEDMPSLFYFQSPENYRTISAPHMISIMLQGLALEANDDLLILGAKSGYIAALAHELAPKGEIIILEANSEIARITISNLRRLNLDTNISVVVKNPINGEPELSPWQKILVTGAIQQEGIYPLLPQLDKNEGVLYAPIGGDFVQWYTQILRVNDEYFGKKQLQVRFTPLMTQIELDELELITDFDEIEIKDDPSKVEKTLSKIDKKIHIKYSPNMMEEFDLEPFLEPPPINIEALDNIISDLKEIKGLIKRIKQEDEVDACFDCMEQMDANVQDLNEYKKDFDIRVKKIQNLLNQIRTYNLIRKELEKKDITEVMDKKVEVINKQLDYINELNDVIKEEMKHFEKLKPK